MKNTRSGKPHRVKRFSRVAVRGIAIFAVAVGSVAPPSLVSAIELPPYNGPLEDDVKDINGSGRNYLLEGWYRRTFELGAEAQLAVTGGIIDSTPYIDENLDRGH